VTTLLSIPFRLRRLALALIVVVATAVTASCSASPSASSGSTSSQDTITVAVLPSSDMAGLYIAQDDGLFAAQGLHVVIKPIASTAVVIAGQVRGQVDIAGGAYVPYIKAEASGGKFRILAPASILQPYTRELVTTSDSRVTSLAGLQGKVIGVNGTGSVGTLLIDELLADHGLSPQSVRFVTDPQGFPGLAGGLRDGRYAAVFLAEPYITSAEMTGDHVLADLYQGGAVGYPMDGYVATQAWVQRNPATAAAFIRAVDQGQLIAQTDAPAVRAVVAKYDHLDPVVTAMMELPGYPLGGPVAQALQAEADDMLQFGIIHGTSGSVTAMVSQMLGP